MKTTRSNTGGIRGFTLIELLVVIAIIGVLAALLLPVAGKIKQRMAIKRAETELAKLQSAIESYKIKLGHYPPDNPLNVLQSPLYFELSGCVRTNIAGTDYFMTLDGSAKIAVTDVSATFGQGGIVNCSTGGGDEGGGIAYRALTEIKPTQFGETVAGNGIRVLGVQLNGPPPVFPSSVGNISPFRYNSSNPTNNVGGFDLWVDVIFGTKTNRVSNWRSTPEVNP